ncbi:MAG TPA: TolC family protein [Pirellulales bacterium]
MPTHRTIAIGLCLPILLLRLASACAQGPENIPPGRRSGDAAQPYGQPGPYGQPIRPSAPPRNSGQPVASYSVEMPPGACLPDVHNSAGAPNISQAAPDGIDQPLPINLATAMQLADARPLVIQAAVASELTAFGGLEKANALWLPDVYLGSDYQRHDGGQIRTTGDVAINDRNQFLTGGGLKAIVALTDAIYAPLAAKQVYRSRSFEVQAAKNDALQSVTDAYFSVQQSRGVLAGTEDTVNKGVELVKRIKLLSQGLAAPIEVQRAQTTLAELEQQATVARQDWRINSANLTRVLRLNPAAIAIPVEPPQLQVTVVPPDASVDQLIADGLLSRPELSAQQSIVRATIDRLKQERMRPLIPSLVLQGAANPGNTLGGGYYEANRTGNDPTWTGRSDWDFQVVWQLENLGAGNTGSVHQRQGEQRQALVELFRIQDQVAADVAQAYAQVIGATARIQQAQYGLTAAQVSFDGNLKGVSETIRAGDQLQLVIRPQEVTAALLQLRQAYLNYYSSINDYNRAQFRLYHALGYPAQQITRSAAWSTPTPADCPSPSELSAPIGETKQPLRR